MCHMLVYWLYEGAMIYMRILRIVVNVSQALVTGTFFFFFSGKRYFYFVFVDALWFVFMWFISTTFVTAVLELVLQTKTPYWCLRQQDDGVPGPAVPIRKQDSLA